MSEIQKYLNIIAEGQHLSYTDTSRVFQIIMAGGATPAQISATLMGLRINGETIDEISGAVLALRAKSKKLNIPTELQANIIDTCGTGGDSKGTYNISTTVAIVLAACGVPVAKHGNKAISSKSGSADVLTALGVKIDISEELAIKSLNEANICFMMAPRYHSAMRHVAPIRLELGMRTIFNLLGPLINPASPKKQLIGVYSKEWVEPIAHVLKKLGSTNVWVVHGSDGMDEITTFGETYIAELKDGEVRSFTINPETLGIEVPEEKALIGGDAIHNAQKLREILKGKEGAYRDIVTINAAAGLVVAGKCDNIKDGMSIISNMLDSGKARDTLEKLVEISNLDI